MRRLTRSPGKTAALVIFGIVLLGCNLGGSFSPTAMPTSAPTLTPTITLTPSVTPVLTPTWLPTPNGAVGPFNFPPDVNPLTGLVVSDPAALKRRPLAAKISNAPALVRPQAGIADADLVFEHITEGSLTRFTAIFWTNTPPRLGSIRSARLIDLELARMYGALFAFSGASGPVRERIFASPFAERAFEGVSIAPPAYYRDDSIDAPHNLFASPQALWARADKLGVDTPPTTLGGLLFSATPQPTGTPGTLIKVDYGPTLAEWHYDAATGRYARWSDGVPHLDANNNMQVTTANVVLLYAWHQLDYTIVESEFQGNKSYSVEIQIWTLGPALVCRDGQCVRGLWNRWSKDDPLSFWTKDHQPIYFKPGNTWFEVVNLPDAKTMQQIITVN